MLPTFNNSGCKDCTLHCHRKNVVNGRGPDNARILVIGEGPGLQEDSKGIAFVGPAGQKLVSMLVAAGIDPASVFYTNTVRCIPKAPPPKNVREPLPDEVTACRKYLEDEIKAINPHVIVPAGNAALKAITKMKAASITKKRGTEFWSEEFNCKVIPIFHPASILRQPKQESITIEDLKRVKAASETREPTRSQVEPGQYFTIDNLELFESTIERLRTVPFFAFDIETSGLAWWKDKVLCISFSWKERTGCTIPLIRYNGREEKRTVMEVKSIRKKINGKFEKVGEREVPVEETYIVDEYYPYWGDQQDYVVSKLREIFKLDQLKIAHNGKFDIKFLMVDLGITVENFAFDTMLAHHLLDENAEGMHGLKECAWVYTDMGGYDAPLEAWFKERGIKADDRNYARLPTAMLYEYAAMDVDCTVRLYQKFDPELVTHHLTNVFDRLIMPLSSTLMRAEKVGIQIDTDYMKEVWKVLSDEIAAIEKEIFEMTGGINLNSPKQLRKLLFEDLKLPIQKYTDPKNGGIPQPSTDEESLEKLAPLHPIPDKITQYRKRFKLLHTYVAGIHAALDSGDRIHTTFLIHGTTTGRLSSREPNLQNIPRDDKRIKKLFISRPGWVIIEADYGQAEFRHWANYCQDPAMLRDLRSGADIHRLTASDIFKVPPEKVTDAQRQQVKGVVFGLMYGRGVPSLAAEFNCTVERANEIVRTFFAKYPVARRWLEEAKKTVLVYKQIRNVFGRIRRLPGIDSSEKGIRADAERQSVNSPIQSAASDMNCNAANKILRYFAEQSLSGELCLLVHDSLLYEVPESEIEQSLNIIKSTMEAPIEGVNVPMIAELKIGTRWGVLEEVIKKEDGWYKVKKQKQPDGSSVKTEERYDFTVTR